MPTEELCIAGCLLIPGSVYYTYESQLELCQCRDSGNVMKQCDLVRGPQKPGPEECGIDY